MVRTTVYLTESEAEGLRRAAARSNRSQSDLIREGVRLITERVGAPGRVFHSMGSGSARGRQEAKRNADKLYRRKVLGDPN